ncbi:MAG: D-alanyl-D-alanine dipeptidase [Chloroflexaceae bacterium]|nr:D-alanyl-D-alanine dipeptidase [Chloroflexaceae bacterium]
MKPYQQIPINECGEPLWPIPPEQFFLELPPPYAKLGADYGGKSPFYLRQGVLSALHLAQVHLQQLHPYWRFKIFDAYRPVAVQQFMVDYTFASLLQTHQLDRANLTPAQAQALWEQVFQLWAPPSRDRQTPPPHSTGSAIDLTLCDANGNSLDLGSAIDEFQGAAPDYYANNPDLKSQTYHHRRQVLNQSLQSAGFRRHPGEWWHFSLGDQLWAWQRNQETGSTQFNARYGGI